MIFLHFSLCLPPWPGGSLVTPGGGRDVEPVGREVVGDTAGGVYHGQPLGDVEEALEEHLAQVLKDRHFQKCCHTLQLMALRLSVALGQSVVPRHILLTVQSAGMGKDKAEDKTLPFCWLIRTNAITSKPQLTVLTDGVCREEVDHPRGGRVGPEQPEVGRDHRKGPVLHAQAVGRHRAVNEVKHN